MPALSQKLLTVVTLWHFILPLIKEAGKNFSRGVPRYLTDSRCRAELF